MNKKIGFSAAPLISLLFIAIAASCFVMFSSDCGAAGRPDPGKDLKLAKEFMTLTNVPQMIEKIFDDIKQRQFKRERELSYAGKTSEKDEALVAKVRDYLDKKLAWSNVEDGYAVVYAEYFTEQELKQMVEFFSSPVAKKLQTGDMELKKKLLESTQMQLKDMALKIKGIENDFISGQQGKKNE